MGGLMVNDFDIKTSRSSMGKILAAISGKIIRNVCDNLMKILETVLGQFARNFCALFLGQF